MGRKGGILRKKQEQYMQGDKRINCPKCGRYIIVTNGKHSNGVQRYRCKSCGARFNENSWKNSLTDKEFFANEFLRQLFTFKRDNFEQAQKKNVKVDTKMITRKIEKRKQKLSYFEELFGESFKFFNIFTLPANVAEQKYEGRASREYCLSERPNEILIMLKKHNDIYLINKMPESKCTNLILETPEYIIEITEKDTSRRYIDLYNERFMKLRKAQEKRAKKNKE